MRNAAVVAACLILVSIGCTQDLSKETESAPRLTSVSSAPPPLPPPAVASSVAAPLGVAGGVIGGQIMKAGTRADYDAGAMNTEEYGRFDENPFLQPANDPLSTFSIDVDRASYANVRRFLREGTRPPRDAVRIEEMINYFSYDYPPPSSGDPVSVTTELSACPWNEAHRLLLVGLQSRKIETRDLPPSNLVFLIDTSGSMQTPDKLPLVKSAMRLLVDQLRRDDRVSIVSYAGSAGLILESTPGSQRGKILEAIDSFEAGGTTAGAEGIVLAYQVAKDNFVRGANNRVILATDGDFNVGVTSDGELLRLIEEKRRDGIFLTVLGFGTGNLKDSKMELLADKGNGNYSYIDTIGEARKALVHEMGATLFTVAKDVKVQVEFNPSAVGAYRLIGYENRLLRAQDFNDDAKDAGELGSGHSVTALYEIVPAGAPVPGARVDPLKYQSRESATSAAELATVKVRYKDPEGETSRLMSRAVANSVDPLPSRNLQLAASVAQLGMLLRDSPNKGSSSFPSIPRIAAEDFPEIVTMAERVIGSHPREIAEGN